MYCFVFLFFPFSVFYSSKSNRCVIIIFYFTLSICLNCFPTYTSALSQFGIIIIYQNSQLNKVKWSRKTTKTNDRLAVKKLEKFGSQPHNWNLCNLIANLVSYSKPKFGKRIRMGFSTMKRQKINTPTKGKQSFPSSAKSKKAKKQANNQKNNRAYWYVVLKVVLIINCRLQNPSHSHKPSNYSDENTKRVTGGVWNYSDKTKKENHFQD